MSFVLAPSSYVSLSGSVLPNNADVRRLSPCASEERIVVLLFLRFAASDAQITEHANRLGRLAPGVRDYARPADFRQADRAREVVEEFAAARGLRLSWPADTGGLIGRLEGSVAQCNAAFRVELHDYFSPVGDFRGYEGALSLPRDVAAVVRGVFGLADRTPPPLTAENEQRRAVVAGDLPGPLANNSVSRIAELYNFPADLAGQNQRIGIIDNNANIRLSEVGTYLADRGVLRVPEIDTRPAGRTRAEFTGAAAGAMSPLQLTAGLVPEASFVVYGIDGYPVDDWAAGFLMALVSALFGAEPVDVLMIHPGAPEYFWTADELNVFSLLFAAGACLGVSMCTGSGDFGAAGFDPSRSHHKANVHFPASSPYVLSCGGTEMNFATRNERTLAFEAVWNNLSRAEKPRATGGGISKVFATPAFQQGCDLPPAQNANAVAGRAVPDVAANAAPDSGYGLYQDGEWIENAGGTVLAAALWAGLIARLNEALGVNLGWLNPLLYQFQIQDDLNVCRPVFALERENCNGPLSNRFSASYCAEADKNYSACTGLGTPDGSKLLAAFQQMSVAETNSETISKDITEDSTQDITEDNAGEHSAESSSAE